MNMCLLITPVYLTESIDLTIGSCQLVNRLALSIPTLQSSEGRLVSIYVTLPKFVLELLKVRGKRFLQYHFRSQGILEMASHLFNWILLIHFLQDISYRLIILLLFPFDSSQTLKTRKTSILEKVNDLKVWPIILTIIKQ